MSKSIKNIVLLTVATLVLATPVLALANSGVVAGTPTLAGLQGLFGANNLTQIIIRFIQLFFGLLGIIVLALLIYAGVLWMSSQGEPDKITKAKNLIYSAVVGLVIIFSAFAIASFVYGYFGPKQATREACNNISQFRGCITTNYCGGEQSCNANTDGSFSWGACGQTDTSCPANDVFKETYANIFKISDPTLATWGGESWKYSNNRDKLIKVPKTDTLQVEAFAHNYSTHGVINAINLWVGSATSTENLVGSMTIATSGSYLVLNRPYYFAWTTSTWAASSSVATATTSLRVSVNNQTEKDYYSKSLRIKFLPSHCFNNRQDEGETGVDCGLSCSNRCGGEACTTSESNECSADNCASGVCNAATCRCTDIPQITYVDPALDLNGDTNRFNLIATQIDDDISNGATNNYVTIFGRNFGSATGTVSFSPIGGGAQVTAQVACAKSWSNNQIVVIVPSTLTANGVNKEGDIASSSQLYNYNINVQAASSTIFSNAWPFQVNQLARPGICQMDPRSGVYPATTTAYGYNFPTTTPRAVVWSVTGEVASTSVSGLPTWYTRPFNITSTATYNWNPYQVTDVVPQNRIGRSGVRVYNGNAYSNYFIFNISDGQVGSPCGYDSSVCDQDVDTCALAGLICQKNCTCQPAESEPCTADEICSIGGCPGTQTCTNGKLGACVTDAKCIKFLSAAANHPIFSWAFVANKVPGPGKSCSSALWNDQTCDLNGCIDPTLACDTTSSTEEFIELYNPTANPIDLTGWKVAYGPGQAIPTAGLVGYYKLDGNLQNSSPVASDVANVSNTPVYAQTNCVNSACLTSANTRVSISNPLVTGVTAGNFTWAVWFRPELNGAPVSYTDILRKDSDTGQGIQLFWKNDTVPEIGFKWENNDIRIARTIRERNKWYHVAVTFDDSAGSKRATLYINGVAVASKADLGMHDVTNNKLLASPIKFGSYDVNDTASYDDALIYNRLLTPQEISSIYHNRDLTGSLAAGDVLTLRGNSALALNIPKLTGAINLINPAGAMVDAVNYGDGANLVTPGYYPGSSGRKNDGLDTDTVTDFTYFKNNSEGTLNTPKKVVANNHLIVNEFSLAHDSCTCVPKTQLCTLGQIDNTTCAPASQCAQIKRCQTSGHFGACELANASCVPYLPTSSTIATYTWNFNTNPAPPTKGPYIVSGCQGDGNCNNNDVLPSPTPWTGRWNKLNYPELNIQNASSCLNAVISARFSESMDPNSINTNTIRIYKASTTGAVSWEDQTNILIDTIGSFTTRETGVNYFKINPKVRLATSSTYLVFVSKKVSDELGRNLIDDASGVNSSYCTGTGVTTTPGVCWQFITRDAGDDNLLCPVGCVNLNPKNYFNRYYLQDRLHDATPGSADNVCLSLNNRDYAWDWFEREQDEVVTNPRSWHLPASIEEGFSRMTDILTNAAGIFHQAANPDNAGQATTTALRETNFRQYDKNSWFGNEDTSYFQIAAQEAVSSHTGYAPAHNNFTDPVVIENQYCSKSDDPTKRVLQSPSPWKNQQDACINAVVFALFSRNMKNDTLVNAANGKALNIEVYKCGANAGNATSTDYSKIIDDCGSNLAANWSASVFNYTQKNLTMQQLIDAAATENSTKMEGVRIYPNENLDKNSWYKVVIKGGASGVRGGTSSTVAGIEIAEGILQVPSRNAQMTTAASTTSYYWYFKTGSDVCSIEQVAVLPQFNYMAKVGLTQEYQADPIAANCNHLNPFNYKWNWKSLFNPFDDRCVNPATGDGVATICALTSVSCPASDTVIRAPFVKAFGQTEGETNITARAESSTTSVQSCSDDKYGYSPLKIGDGFAISNPYNDNCLNTELSFDFTAEASSTSLLPNTNIFLYQCAVGDTDCNDLTPISGLTLKVPTDTAKPTKKVVLAPTANLSTNTAYRVIVKGGVGGVKSANGSFLAGLNYNLGGVDGGEACDLSTDPNNDLLKNVCGEKCIFKADANLCGTKYQECDNKQGLLAYYNFDNNYQEIIGVRQGAISTSTLNFVTGRSKQALNFNSPTSYISFGETVSFSTGSISLWVRSTNLTGIQRLSLATSSAKNLTLDLVNNTSTNVRQFVATYGSVQVTSSNARINNQWTHLVLSYDNNNLQLYIDGKLAAQTSTNFTVGNGLTTLTLGGSSFTGDLDELATYNRVLTASEVSSLYSQTYPINGIYGCNTLCQKSGNNTASCGNGKIDAGEQCDDGNNDNTDLCNNNCLWRGVTDGTCGNKVLDNGQTDSYSWTFKLSSSAKVCNALDWSGLNPCPNGIWSFGADSAVTNLKVMTYQGSATNLTGLCIKDEDLRQIGFWHRVINYIVKVIRSFFGLQTVNAAAFWCPINQINLGTEELRAMTKGNYSSSTINFSNGNTAKLLAYTDDANNFKVNIIRDTDWSTGTEYKFVALYNKNGIIGTSTANITTFNSAASCQLNSIRFDVWPRGLAKTADAFNCASNPATGKSDDCGRYSADLYDDDMSTAWTKDYPGNGYDLRSDANVGGATSYLPGNQHLYRLWALTANKYVVRANFANIDLTNVSAESTSTAISGTPYGGDLWLTSGFKPGKSLLTATAFDPGSAGRAVLGGGAKGDLPIYTFFCNNIWPDIKNFPFIDSSNNCSVGGGSCINTNFGTYYCRDAGIAKSCVKGDYIGRECTANADCFGNKAMTAEASCQLNTYDDLPSIGDYDALSGKITRGVAFGSTGDSCQTLPSTFKLKVGYHSYVDETNYVWDTNNVNIYRNPGSGWEKIDKGLWQLNGLPATFKPTFAYSVTTTDARRDYLWSNSEIYVYNGVQWTVATAIKTQLQSIGFWPTGGYFWSGHNQAGLFDSSGRIVVLNYDPISGAFVNASAPVAYTAAGFTARPKMFVDYSQGDRGPIMLDVNGGIWQVTSSANLFQLQTVAPAFTSSFNPIWGYQDSANSVSFGLDPKYYALTYTSENNWTSGISAATTYKTCDNKLKEFLFAGIKPESGSDIYLAGNSTYGTPAKAYEEVYDGAITTSWGANTGQSTTIYQVTIPETGNYYVTLETSNNSTNTTRLPVGFTGDYGACYQGTALNGRDVYQKIKVYLDNDSTTATDITALASAPENRQLNRTYISFYLTKGTHIVDLAWLNDCNCAASEDIACGYGNLDSNLRIYSVRLTNVNRLNTSDAIGFRVYNNSQHYSAALWYKTKFNPYSQGSLQELNIDGNKAVSEGRTVYVNAPDFGQISNAANDYMPVTHVDTSLYSTVYLMSYNEGASKTTLNIFNQMVNNWFFNAGSHNVGGLDTASDVGSCSEGSGEANTCLTDIDCMKRGTGYCLSTKAKVTRDTIRLSDVQNIYVALGNYYSRTRCSNDLTRSCTTNANCFGGGACGNFYPNLLSGTYVSGKTYSIWPSWQQTLGKELGVTLPVDPLNLILASSSGTAVKCSEPYNPDTCWSERDGQMECNIHSNSSFYAYYGTKFGATNGGIINPSNVVSVYAKGELFSNNSGNWRPDWATVTNIRINPFDGYTSQITGRQFCTRIANTCGNGVADTGENCSNCPLDMGCGVGTACQNVTGSWTCGPLRKCGDTLRQVGEECDGVSGCSAECYCEDGYDCSSGTPTAVHGDGVVSGDEECDIDSAGIVVGCIGNNPNNPAQGCCNTDTGMFNPWYTTLLGCGDGITQIEKGEGCDCGKVGDYIFGLNGNTHNNSFVCYGRNGIAEPPYGSSLTPTQYCGANCQTYTANNVYCGDSVFTATSEQCDKALPNGGHCDENCKIVNNPNGNVVCGASGCYDIRDGQCDRALGEGAIPACDPTNPCCRTDGCDYLASGAGRNGVTCGPDGSVTGCPTGFTFYAGQCYDNNRYVQAPDGTMVDCTTPGAGNMPVMTITSPTCDSGSACQTLYTTESCTGGNAVCSGKLGNCTLATNQTNPTVCRVNGQCCSDETAATNDACTLYDNYTYRLKMGSSYASAIQTHICVQSGVVGGNWGPDCRCSSIKTINECLCVLCPSGLDAIWAVKHQPSTGKAGSGCNKYNYTYCENGSTPLIGNGHESGNNVININRSTFGINENWQLDVEGAASNAPLRYGSDVKLHSPVPNVGNLKEGVDGIAVDKYPRFSPESGIGGEVIFKICKKNGGVFDCRDAELKNGMPIVLVVRDLIGTSNIGLGVDSETWHSVKWVNSGDAVELTISANNGGIALLPNNQDRAGVFDGVVAGAYETANSSTAITSNQNSLVKVLITGLAAILNFFKSYVI